MMSFRRDQRGETNTVGAIAVLAAVVILALVIWVVFVDGERSDDGAVSVPTTLTSDG